MRKYLEIVYIYYTFWAMVLHVGYLIGRLPNTWIVAIVVLVCSQFFLFVAPGYVRMYGIGGVRWLHELINHRLPVFVIPILVSRESVILLLISLTIYVLIHRSRLGYYYQDTNKVVDEILSS